MAVRPVLHRNDYHGLSSDYMPPPGHTLGPFLEDLRTPLMPQPNSLATSNVDGLLPVTKWQREITIPLVKQYFAYIHDADGNRPIIIESAKENTQRLKDGGMPMNRKELPSTAQTNLFDVHEKMAFHSLPVVPSLGKKNKKHMYLLAARREYIFRIRKTNFHLSYQHEASAGTRSQLPRSIPGCILYRSGELPASSGSSEMSSSSSLTNRGSALANPDYQRPAQDLEKNDRPTSVANG